MRVAEQEGQQKTVVPAGATVCVHPILAEDGNEALCNDTTHRRQHHIVCRSSLTSFPPLDSGMIY